MAVLGGHTAEVKCAAVFLKEYSLKIYLAHKTSEKNISSDSIYV